jgi:deoxycytidylate deaminase
MNKSIDLSYIYSLRQKFSIIGLTGRTGSGCTTIANQLKKGFNNVDFPAPLDFDLNNNSFRKYKIIYNYATQNFKSYEIISYRDIITLFIIRYNLDDLIAFINSKEVEKQFSNQSLISIYDLSAEISALNNLKEDFEKYQKSILGELNFNIRGGTYLKEIGKEFLSEDFQAFSKKLHGCLSISYFTKNYLIFQLISNNIRKSGEPYNSELTNSINVFAIAEMVNFIIKTIGKLKGETKIVIDSIRNPIEANYFKQKYAAFYLIAINRDDKERELKLKTRYNASEFHWIEKLIDIEYKGTQNNGFHGQFVRECIEKSDIHITYRGLNDVNSLNSKIKDNTTPYYSWQMQLLKFITLIDHPGLVTPSPEERSMQLAFTAKYNSGCISRQVGAAVTDEYYSVKAIGWNNTPEGHVPCQLRNAEALINATPEELRLDSAKNYEDQNPELKAFTPYEKNNLKFKEALTEHYTPYIEGNSNLKGRSVCFCFKSLHNSCFDGKNQVHTRSLHAEESAFLQITKYGGTSIKNGKLFTTASPCELCSKKAYQLGIKVIYYIDPYPGISKEQILEAGNNKPEVRLFNGAIGNAYHWLYEPFMAYKDELALILGHNIKDLASKQDETIKAQQSVIDGLTEELERFKANSTIK